MASRIDSLPKAFIWRRLHSLMGLWLVLFLMEHLLTNSQAALLLGESGQGFVRMVNGLHNLPFLPLIELFLLGVPIAIHGYWGIRYLFTAEYNSFSSDGSKPHLSYGRNRAYTWQRITSWILVVLLTMHIVKFRFLEYPGVVNKGSHPTYFVTVKMDTGLYTVSQRLGAQLYDSERVKQLQPDPQKAVETAAQSILSHESHILDADDEQILCVYQTYEEQKRFADALDRVRLKPGEVIVAAGDFGTATLFSVRDTFKSPYWALLYTIFVLAACFHAFNGLWTSMLTWGWVVKVSSQRSGLKFALTLMAIVTFLGLAAIWGTYYLNLKT